MTHVYKHFEDTCTGTTQNYRYTDQGDKTSSLQYTHFHDKGFFKYNVKIPTKR